MYKGYEAYHLYRHLRGGSAATEADTIYVTIVEIRQSSFTLFIP